MTPNDRRDESPPPPGEPGSVRIGTGYALGRLARALDTTARHEDPAVRERAQAKVGKWRAVIEGMATGALDVGSRTPVADTPAWVTLEVAHGGFATGRYLAEGELLEHEREDLAALPIDVPGDTPRARLNAWFSSDAGQSALVDAIERGAYRIEVPEEGALPVVAWLLHRGRDVDALELLAQLRPLMHRLRFYPRRLAKPRPTGALVRVAQVDEVASKLGSARPQPRVAAMNEALRVWAPLFDRLVSLWLETVEGEVPRHRREADGKRARRPDGQPILEGGWPARRWPSDWIARREQWLAEYKAAAREHELGAKHRNPKGNFAILRDALQRCPQDSAALSGRDVGRIRHALAGTVSRLGQPGGEQRVALRRTQAEVASRPTFDILARIVAARARRYPAEGGLPSLDVVAGRVTAEEASSVGGILAPGVEVPAHLIAKTARALEAPIDELIERGVIGSAEVLAIVLPQITSQVAAAGIEDAPLRDLFAQIYAAFRRRRSLLLVDYASQVRIDELPWVSALAGVRQESIGAEAAARQTLEQVTLLALSSFPQTILPNPLVREMAALVKQAKLELPLVEEVAADIFMGSFTEKWGRAADVATRVLRGTAYARYYGLPTEPSPPKAKRRPGRGRAHAVKLDERFAKLCGERAKEATGTGDSYVARNGVVIEQSMVLTTHNLAALYDKLDVAADLTRLAPDLARRVFGWVVRRQTTVAPDHHGRLIVLKNTAYAWRQAIFYLSLCDAPVQRDVFADLQAQVARQGESLRERFEPVLAGLRHVLEGGEFDTDGKAPNGGRRFLGWYVGHHWLTPKPPKPRFLTHRKDQAGS